MGEDKRKNDSKEREASEVRKGGSEKTVFLGGDVIASAKRRCPLRIGNREQAGG